MPKKTTTRLRVVVANDLGKKFVVTSTTLREVVPRGELAYALKLTDLKETLVLVKEERYSDVPYQLVGGDGPSSGYPRYASVHFKGLTSKTLAIGCQDFPPKSARVILAAVKQAKLPKPKTETADTNYVILRKLSE